jgi:ParB family chromosome partitioning protein
MPKRAEPTKKKTSRRRSKPAEAASRGLEARELSMGSAPPHVVALASSVRDDGGSVLAVYREPLAGHWQILAGIPLDRVAPTPYQRDLSEAHVARLRNAMDKLGRFLDPVIAVRTAEGTYWTPNGHHRTNAMRQLGAHAVVALVVPESEVAHRILLLNTEKSHNLRERATEVVRLATALSELDPRPENEFEAEFEEAPLVTLGCCYEERGRFAGSAFHPILRRIDAFSTKRLPDALAMRRERATRLLALEDAVNDAVASLKKRGLDSPYLKAFVVARVNPIRFQRGGSPEFDDTIDRMLASARRFDVAKVKADQVAKTGGAPDESS